MSGENRVQVPSWARDPTDGVLLTRHDASGLGLAVRGPAGIRLAGTLAASRWDPLALRLEVHGLDELHGSSGLVLSVVDGVLAVEVVPEHEDPAIVWPSRDPTDPTHLLRRRLATGSLSTTCEVRGGGMATRLLAGLPWRSAAGPEVVRPGLSTLVDAPTHEAIRPVMRSVLHALAQRVATHAVVVSADPAAVARTMRALAGSGSPWLDDRIRVVPPGDDVAPARGRLLIVLDAPHHATPAWFDDRDVARVLVGPVGSWVEAFEQTGHELVRVGLEEPVPDPAPGPPGTTPVVAADLDAVSEYWSAVTEPSGALRLEGRLPWPLEGENEVVVEPAALVRADDTTTEATLVVRALEEVTHGAAVSLRAVRVPPVEQLVVPTTAADVRMVERTLVAPERIGLRLLAERLDEVRDVRVGDTSRQAGAVDLAGLEDAGAPDLQMIDAALDEARSELEELGPGWIARHCTVVVLDTPRLAERFAADDGRSAERMVGVNPDGTTVARDGRGQVVRVVDLCHAGHVTDTAWVVTCAGCAEVRCPDCDGGVDFADCRGCDRRVCGACLSGGVCAACRTPLRRPDLDTVSEHAYELTGRLLFVSRAGFRLVDPSAPGETRQRTDVPDLAPSTRARRAALAAGLPWDARVVGTRNKGHRTPKGRSWQVDQRRVPVWEVRDEPSDLREVDPLPGLPLGPEIPVETERGDQLCVLVANLRAREAPPCPGELVVRHATDTVDVVLDGDGLHARTREHDHHGQVQTLRDLLPFSPVDPAVDRPDGVLVARAGHRGVTVEVLRRDRSHVVVVDDHGRREVLNVGSATDPGEALAWHRILSALDLATRATVRVADGSQGDVDGPEGTPGQAQLLSREMTIHPTIVEHGGRRPIAGDIEAFDRVAIEEDHVQLGLLESAGVARALDAAGISPPPAVVLRPVQVVAESWQGDGLHDLFRTRAEDGSLPLVEPDDGGPATATFWVDTAGHLHAPDRGWRCDGCAATACAGCPDIMRLAPCTACSGPACGRCRRPSGAVLDTCRDCGEVACSGCGRELDRQSCSTCDRSVCRSCIGSGGSCAACREMKPAAPVPAWVAPWLGTQLQACRATVREGSWLVSVAHGDLRALVVLDADAEPVRVVLDDATPLARTSLALGRRLGVPATAGRPSSFGRKARPTKWEVDVEETDEGVVHVLRRHEEILELQVADAYHRVTAGTPATRDRRLAQSVDPDWEGPEPVQVHLRHVAFVARPPDARRVRVKMRQVTVDHLVSADGLRLRLDDEVEAIGWEAGETLRAGWHVRRQALGSSGWARLEQLPGAHNLVVGWEDGEVVLPLAGGDLGPGLAAVVSGQGHVVQVLGVVDRAVARERLDLPVAEATWVPVLLPAGTSRPRRPTLTALQTWSGGLVDQRPRAEVEDEAVALLARVLPDPESLHGPSVLLGYDLTATVEVIGAARRLDLRVTPTPEGVEFVWDGGRTARLSADRDGHLGGDRSTCAYCQSVTCKQCEGPAAPCMVCRIQQCRRCRSDPVRPLCHACADLHPVSRRWARKRFSARTKEPLSGSDEVHEVLVDASGSAPVVLVLAGGVAPRRAAPEALGVIFLRETHQ